MIQVLDIDFDCISVYVYLCIYIYTYMWTSLVVSFVSFWGSLGISTDLYGNFQGSVFRDLWGSSGICLWGSSKSSVSGDVGACPGISGDLQISASGDLHGSLGDLLGIFRRNLQVSLGMSKDPWETNEKQNLQGSPGISHIYGYVRNHRKKLELWRREEREKTNIYINIYMERRGSKKKSFPPLQAIYCI